MRRILFFLLILNLFIPRVSASTQTAHEYILMDMNTGRILDGKNYNNKMLIASITKIMTCVLAIESNKLDEVVTVDDTILKSYGSGIYIEVGEKLKLKDLLYGLMLRSGNDAALMISKYVSGSTDKFVEKMNEKAKEIGMTNTIFNNPSGLDETDEGNYSTAYDMAILTKYAMQYKEYREIVKTKKYTLKTNKKTYIWKNKNKLLNYDYITGGKTGYTEKAKRTLVSTATKDNMNFIVVTIKDSDDWNTHTSLYKYAFENYKPYMVLNKEDYKIYNKTYKNNLYIKNNVYIPLKEGEPAKLKNKIMLNKVKKYKNKQLIGYNNIYLDNEIICKEPIYIKKEIKKNKKDKTIFDYIRSKI